VVTDADGAAMNQRRPSGGRVSLLLPALDAIDELPDDQLPAVLTQLSALLARVAARQAAGLRREEPAAADDLLEVDEVATLTRRSVSWLHHHGRTLPGFHQPHGKGGRKFWSRRALMRWITDGDSTSG
jgi:hypothetical protein